MGGGTDRNEGFFILIRHGRSQKNIRTLEDGNLAKGRFVWLGSTRTPPLEYRFADEISMRCSVMMM